MNGSTVSKTIIRIFAVIAITLLLFSCKRELQADIINTKPADVYTGSRQNETPPAIGAKIIYMKYFTLSSSYSVSYGMLDASMAGKENDVLQEHFDGWEVIYTDKDKVILEKTIESYGPRTYEINTLKENDDEFVCVYSYDESGEKVLYSVFDTPVMLFDDITVRELRQGIIITGEEALHNALEDFGE